jgi:hypothetical protein
MQRPKKSLKVGASRSKFAGSRQRGYRFIVLDTCATHGTATARSKFHETAQRWSRLSANACWTNGTGLLKSLSRLLLAVLLHPHEIYRLAQECNKVRTGLRLPHPWVEDNRGALDKPLKKIISIMRLVSVGFPF